VTRSPLETLLSACGEGGLDQASLATLKSLVLTVPEQDIDAALGYATDCEQLGIAVCETLTQGTRSWSPATLTRLAESLLLNQLDEEAATVDRRLQPIRRGDRRVIKIWAALAPTVEEGVRRFIAGLADASDRDSVLRDAEDYARGNGRADLLRMLKDP